MENDNSMAELVSVIRGRAAFYEFFSLAFREPADEKFLGIIKDFLPHFQAFANELGYEGLVKGAEKLDDFVKNNMKDGFDKEELLNAMNRAYTSLFLLGGTSVATSESVYLSVERLLKQEPWEEVIKFYRENRFGMPKSFKETEDHVSMEMLFMYFLAENMAKSLEEDDMDKAEELLTAQNRFMNEHIARWVPQFCDLVLSRKGDHIIFMDIAAMLLKGYLEYDKEFLMELTTEE